MKSHGFCSSFFPLMGVVCLCLAQLSGSPLANAAGKDSDDEYDFSWLDPDKKVYVLQNRKFRKDGRMMLSLMPGLGMSEPYRETINIEPRIAYYFSESAGIEAFFTLMKASANSASDALQGTIANNASFPVIREYQSQYGALFHWAPWYAKINVFNTILYFDWYFSGGAGQIKYQFDSNRTKGQAAVMVDRTKTAFYLGTGHHYHLSQHWGIRLDLMGAFYNAKIFEGSSGESALYSNFNFSFGIGYRL